jgi:hypothetical protein
MRGSGRGGRGRSSFGRGSGGRGSGGCGQQQQSRHNQPRRNFPPDLLQPTTAMGAPFAKCASRQDIRRLNAGTVLMRIMFQRNDTLLLL